MHEATRESVRRTCPPKRNVLACRLMQLKAILDAKVVNTRKGSLIKQGQGSSAVYGIYIDMFCAGQKGM